MGSRLFDCGSPLSSWSTNISSSGCCLMKLHLEHHVEYQSYISRFAGSFVIKPLGPSQRYSTNIGVNHRLANRDPHTNS